MTNPGMEPQPTGLARPRIRLSKSELELDNNRYLGDLAARNIEMYPLAYGQPTAYVEPSVAEIAGQIAVDIEGSSKLLRAYGQSEAEASAIYLAFVDGNRLNANNYLPPDIGVSAWHEPGGKRYRMAGDDQLRGYLEYPNFIGLPIYGPEVLSPDGLKRFNESYKHELGHCATRKVPVEPTLYHQEADGSFSSNHKLVHGVLPVSLAVKYLRQKGKVEFEARWMLDKQERLARAFERRHADFRPVVLQSEVC